MIPADAARHAAHYVAEVTYGTTPNNPPFKRLRHTGLTLGVQRGSLQSNELRPDRQIADFRLGAHSVAGDVTGELSFTSYDDLLEAVLGGTWTLVELDGITFSADGDDDSFNDSANGFLAAGFRVGLVFTVAGFTTGGNNGTFKVATVTAGKITVTNEDGTAAATIADEVAGDAVTMESTESFLTAGTVRRSFSLLRHFTDISATGEGKPYHLFKGVEFNSVAFNTTANGLVTATFNAMGREGAAPSNTPPAGSTFAAAPTTIPMDAFTGEVRDQDGVLGIATEFNFTVENGMEARPVIGSKFGLQPSIGRSNLTGTLTVFLTDSVFVNRFVNEVETALAIDISDGENSYIMEIPRLKFTAGQPDISGQGSVPLAMPFQAVMDPDSLTNIVIRRVPAAA